MEFKAFDKISHVKNAKMQITQKIHGTNAQVFVMPVEELSLYDANEIATIDGKHFLVRAGSRTRWIYPGNDNFGFASYVRVNKEAFARLGQGKHFGEWAGLGINSGEGLKEKYFVLFDYWKYPPERTLPPNCLTVPVLYEGPINFAVIDEVMAKLKSEGSRLSPGFMRPEGVVVNVFGQRIKKVFDEEETAWTGGDPLARELKAKALDESFDQVKHLLQPIRLEKLLSRDEAYLTGFPATLPQICKDYIKDLFEEGQIVGDESAVESTKKVLGKHLFRFVKETVSATA